MLFTGGPGTGKTTAAMQFLQAGLEMDEQCVFISSEQAVSNLQSGLEGFGFNLQHPNLTLTTVHGSLGESATSGDAELVIRTLDGGTPLDEGRSVPFTPDYIHQYLERLAPADRIVLDSASGLAAVTDNHAQYRRVMIDIIRQFKKGIRGHVDPDGAGLRTTGRHRDESRDPELLTRPPVHGRRGHPVVAR